MLGPSEDNIILAYARRNPGFPILWKNLSRKPTLQEQWDASEVLQRRDRSVNPFCAECWEGEYHKAHCSFS